MIFKAKCCYCNSENLRVIDITIDLGRDGEITERVFKCYGCDENLCLDEADIEEVE